MASNRATYGDGYYRDREQGDHIPGSFPSSPETAQAWYPQPDGMSGRYAPPYAGSSPPHPQRQGERLRMKRQGRRSTDGMYRISGHWRRPNCSTPGTRDAQARQPPRGTLLIASSL